MTVGGDFMTAENRQAQTPEPVAGNYFVSAYPPFSCWKEDATAAFRRRLDDAAATPDAPFGLYVHIPFCVHRCQYCYYLAFDGRLGEMGEYLAAVGREFKTYRATPALADRPLSFLYFGGGTPSLASISQLEGFFGELQATAPWDDVEEATFECAPKSVTAEKMRLLRSAGITRLSLGIQQLDDDVLEKNGRVHGVDDVLRAYERIRRVGFDVVNLDLIVGLVGETEESFGRSLDGVLTLAPDSVTLYQLEVPYNTPLYKTIQDGSLEAEPADWSTKRGRLARAFAALESAGYTLISGYTAVRDPEHVRFMYQDAQYRGGDLLGVGVSSFSYLGGYHQQNVTRLADYLGGVSDGRLPLGRAYHLDPDEQLIREFVLQLKLGAIDLAALRERHGLDPLEHVGTALERHREAGWLEAGPDRITLTREGLLRVDRMIPEYYLTAHRVGRYS
jgi:oxygen-independent coproporphyrinogen-3 oxidase